MMAQMLWHRPNGDLETRTRSDTNVRVYVVIIGSDAVRCGGTPINGARVIPGFPGYGVIVHRAGRPFGA